MHTQHRIDTRRAARHRKARARQPDDDLGISLPRQADSMTGDDLLSKLLAKHHSLPTHSPDNTSHAPRCSASV
jgi:hypothetical protein